MEAFPPSAVDFSSGVRFEITGPFMAAFRSDRRNHVWAGQLYVDLGLALARSRDTREIVAMLEPRHGSAQAFWGLKQLIDHSLVVPAGGASLPPAETGEFGDPDAPFRVLVGFEPEPHAATPHGPGYHVFGKGTTLERAAVGRLGETVERRNLYASATSYATPLNAAGLRRAIPPSALLPPELNVNGYWPRQWTPVKSIVTGQTRFLPASYCWHCPPGHPLHDSRVPGDSTGCAAGANLDHAICGGLFEIVERESLRRWCGGQTVGRFVDGDSCASRLVQDTKAYLGARQRTLEIIDLTTVPEIPAYLAASFDHQRRGVIGIAAGFHPLAAIESAVLELGMAFNWTSATSYGSHRLINVASFAPWVRIDSGAPVAPPSDASRWPETAEAAAMVMRHHGRDLLVLDMSRPGDPFPTVRVTVPGMHRFNPGHMYTLVSPS